MVDRRERGLSRPREFLEAGFDVLADRVADDVVRAAQAGERLRVGELALLHDDRRLDVPVRAAQQRVRLVVLEAEQADGAQLGEEFVKGGRACRLPPVDVGFDLTLKQVPQCLAENLMFVRLDHTQDATTG